MNILFFCLGTQFLFVLTYARINWKPEKLAPLDRLGAQLRSPLKPLGVILLWCSRGFRWALNFADIMPRDASLSIACIVVIFPIRLQALCVSPTPVMGDGGSKGLVAGASYQKHFDLTFWSLNILQNLCRWGWAYINLTFESLCIMLLIREYEPVLRFGLKIISEEPVSISNHRYNYLSLSFFHYK